MDNLTFKKMLKPYLENLPSGGQIKLGGFSRDMTEATGSVSYTGVGFQPKCLVFISAVETTSFSVGFDDGTNHYCVRGFNSYGSILFMRAGGSSIYLADSAVATQSGYVTSMDSDGFTFYWVKSASPTSMGYVYYMAFG